MILESLLAYAHILAILTLVVFLASEAALCRVEWLNAAVVERLGKIDMVYGIAAGTVSNIDAARNELTVKNEQSGQTVTLSLGARSSLRRLTPEFEQAIAQRAERAGRREQRRGAGQGGGGAQDGGSSAQQGQWVRKGRQIILLGL